MSTRSLVRELLLRSPLARSARIRGRLGVQPTAPLPTTGSFAVLTRAERPPIQLLDDYRSTIKSGWRWYFWPLATLLELRARGPLSPEHEELLSRELDARTLTRPLSELATAASEAAAARPHDVAEVGWDDDAQATRLVVLPTPEQTESVAAGYTASARSLAAVCARHGRRLVDARVLDIGTATGGLAFAIAAAGAQRAVGVDIDLSRSEWPQGIALRGRLDPVGRAELLAVDAESLPFADGELDVVASYSTLEHIADVDAALAEQRRVLDRRGLAYHVFDPWFSPQGGHSLCTLDFPWGHVRLEAEEAHRYFDAFRPNEARTARAFYDDEFQQPRRTLAQIETAFAAAGFEILEWRERSERFRLHQALLTADVVEDCRRVHPHVGLRDLLVDSVAVVARPR